LFKGNQEKSIPSLAETAARQLITQTPRAQDRLRCVASQTWIP